MPIRPSRPDDIDRLYHIWDGAVRATHDFLDPADRAAIARLVRDDYLPYAAFWVAARDDDAAVGFMGLSNNHVDALFVDPDAHGQGIGRRLIDHASGLHAALTTDVNEQNDGAVGFYERMGFRRTGRSATDDQGRPYPLLHLRLG